VEIVESGEATFRAHVREWLAENLRGEFDCLRGLGGPGREHENFEGRLAWDRHLAAAGWGGLGWPKEFGGCGASIAQQVIFHEEYAAADAPARVGHFGENLLGPTLIDFGDRAQQQRFLPEILSVRELWCQGYSEPGAGSDLASVATTARAEGDRWVIDGQKVWTSLAHVADWCFLLARTEPGSSRHSGLSYLLVPLAQDGVTVRPIRQLTGDSEFNEVFFDGATTDIGNVVGAVGDGWRVAMGTLAMERGVSTLGQQVGFAREFGAVADLARRNGTIDDPDIRRELATAYVGLKTLRSHALCTLGADDEPGQASVMKLLWAGWHRELGELAMRIRGMDGLLVEGELDALQRLFLFSKADTIYGGSNEIQRNIIAERVLGLPKEPRA
jgi:alkylation response protein AidB-like acyl-CoA dehydrogenase